MQKSEPVVAYFYDEELCNYNYGGGNPMRPHRVRLTHNLVHNYGLDKKLNIRRPTARTEEQITQFHADDYVDFLKSVTPDNQDEYMQQLRRFNMGAPGEADCPVFDGVFEYCALYSGGSVDGAALLGANKSDICLNWSGGMHHAKKAEASGFCYINDIVLAILELLKSYQRVLYIDIDIHHGDGVEEAFYLTDRVMTVSFHKYGDFFPGTGAVGDVGTGKGQGYCVNVPLREGMDNESYRNIYEPVMTKVMEVFQPHAVVMCCGADSLSGDRLGCFNLSLEGHSNCIEFIAKYGVPLLCLGGGGYTMRNVSRCWCYETGRLTGVDLDDNIPEGAMTDYNYFMDTQRLRIAVSNMRNANSGDELERIKVQVLENLCRMPPAPSVQFHEPPPKQELPDAPEEDPDVRGGGQAHDEARIVKDGYDSDEEADDGRGARRDAAHTKTEVKEEAEVKEEQEEEEAVKQEQQQPKEEPGVAKAEQEAEEPAAEEPAAMDAEQPEEAAAPASTAPEAAAEEAPAPSPKAEAAEAAAAAEAPAQPAAEEEQQAAAADAAATAAAPADAAPMEVDG